MDKFETCEFKKFQEKFMNKLKVPSCLPSCIEELSGGWTQETLKQIIQKLTKKNSAPLVLWFDSWQSMETISNKKQALKSTFDMLNTRDNNRIDSCELLSVILFMAKGDEGTVFGNIPVIFGFQSNSYITKDEFFFFLDSFFRGISKILIVKNQKSPQNVNRRLKPEDIKNMVDIIFEKKQMYQNEELPIEEALKTMKIKAEIRQCLNQLTLEVEKRSNANKK